jgi:hypothetical protein
VVVATQQSHALLFPPETLPVLEGVSAPAGTAVFALVVYAAGSVGETDLGVQEILGLALGTDPVRIGFTVEVFLFALEEPVEEVPLSTDQALVAGLGAVLLACSLALHAFALSIEGVVVGTQFAEARSGAVDQAVGVVGQTASIFQVELRFALHTAIRVASHAVLKATDAGLENEGSLTFEAALAGDPKTMGDGTALKGRVVGEGRSAGRTAAVGVYASRLSGLAFPL